jgi:hypothetical protein
MTASAVGIVKNKFSSCFGYIDMKLKIFFLWEIKTVGLQKSRKRSTHFVSIETRAGPYTYYEIKEHH